MSQALLTDWYMNHAKQINPLDGTLVELGPDQWGVFRFCDYDLAADPAADGTMCLNPQAPLNKKVYAKYFDQSTIHQGFVSFDDKGKQILHGDVAIARKVLRWDDPRVVTFGWTGYSIPKGKLTQKRYQTAARYYIIPVVQELVRRFGIIPTFSDGGSSLGIDQLIGEIAAEYGYALLRHSCPLFLFYVKDVKGQTILVSPSQDRYSDTFVANLHILGTLGGGPQAFMHDMKAAFLLKKFLLIINMVPFLIDEEEPLDEDAPIIDATALFHELMHIPGSKPCANEWELQEQTIGKAVAIMHKLFKRRGIDAYELWQKVGIQTS